MKKQIQNIAQQSDLSIDERISLILQLREQFNSEDDNQRLQNDTVIFTALIEMVDAENQPHVYDLEMLQLYALLAETFVELGDYRSLETVAHGVLDLIRYEVTPWEAMAETMPRILDAVGESVYNHALYELHLHFIRTACRVEALDDKLAGRVRKMLKLKILLEDDGWLDRLIDKDLEKTISSILPPGELLRIILRPQIGHLKKDPIEYSWKWEKIYYDVEEYLEERFANAPRAMGFCFHYWAAKKEYLSDKYGIEWHSPSQMNPGVMFD